MSKYDLSNNNSLNSHRVAYSNPHLALSKNSNFSNNNSLAINKIISNNKYKVTSLSPVKKVDDSKITLSDYNFSGRKKLKVLNSNYKLNIDNNLFDNDNERYSLANQNQVNNDKILDMNKGRNIISPFNSNANPSIQSKILEEDHPKNQSNNNKSLRQNIIEKMPYSPILNRLTYNPKEIEQLNNLSEVELKNLSNSVHLPNVFREKNNSASQNKDKLPIVNRIRISKVATLSAPKLINSIKIPDNQNNSEIARPFESTKKGNSPDNERNLTSREYNPESLINHGISSIVDNNNIILKPIKSRKTSESQLLKNNSSNHNSSSDIKIETVKKTQKTLQNSGLYQPPARQASLNESSLFKKINNKISNNRGKENNFQSFSRSNNPSPHFDEKSESQITNKKKQVNKNYSYKSQAGKNELGLTKINQDSYVVISNVLNLEDFNIFGVLDGHGSNGHHASGAICNFFNEFFTSHKNYTVSKQVEYLGLENGNKKTKLPTPKPERIKIKTSKELNFFHLEEESVYEKLKENNYEIIRRAFKQAEEELSKAKFDVNLSGSTSVIVFTLNDKIICANSGDSRAIIVSENKSNGKNEFIISKRSLNGLNFYNYQVKFLSNDHKPELEFEKRRILHCGGRVDKFSENGIQSGPYRVWLKNENYPGLAMSRSIGDLIAASVGVISDPEIIEHEINEDSKYVVIASDGIWEFLDNSIVMNIVNPYYLKNDPDGACNALIKEAVLCWEREDFVVDDITVIIIFINCK